MPRPQPLVLGIDPGRHTGVVLRQGRTLIAHQVIEVVADRQPVTVGAVRRLVFDCESMLMKHGRSYATAAVGIVLVAVEDVVEPNPHLGTINVRALLKTAEILGALIGHDWPLGAKCVKVRPGGNGAGMLGSYPEALITPGERQQGLLRPAGQSALIRHARSAWDVAGKGPTVARASGPELANPLRSA